VTPAELEKRLDYGESFGFNLLTRDDEIGYLIVRKRKISPVDPVRYQQEDSKGYGRWGKRLLNSRDHPTTCMLLLSCVGISGRTKTVMTTPEAMTTD
jgi:hypothetical protein